MGDTIIKSEDNTVRVVISNFGYSIDILGKKVSDVNVQHDMNRLTDKEAWKIGQFLWNIQPNHDTTDVPPVFFTFRDNIYKELDVRKITHP